MSFLSKPNREGGEIRLLSRHRFFLSLFLPVPVPMCSIPSVYRVVPEEEEPSLVRRCWLAGAEGARFMKTICSGWMHLFFGVGV
jgi:hypothetical protein